MEGGVAGGREGGGREGGGREVAGAGCGQGGMVGMSAAAASVPADGDRISGQVQRIDVH